MSMTVPTRLPESVKEVVRRQIAKQAVTTPVQLSRILRDIRSTIDASHVTDEELVRQVVMDATNHGFSVHFDREAGLDDKNCDVLLGLRPGRFETSGGNCREINDIGKRGVKNAASNFEHFRANRVQFLRAL